MRYISTQTFFQNLAQLNTNLYSEPVKDPDGASGRRGEQTVQGARSRRQEKRGREAVPTARGTEARGKFKQNFMEKNKNKKYWNYLWNKMIGFFTRK
jgi:hypothetical protein